MQIQITSGMAEKTYLQMGVYRQNSTEKMPICFQFGLVRITKQIQVTDKSVISVSYTHLTLPTKA